MRCFIENWTRVCQSWIFLAACCCQFGWLAKLVVCRAATGCPSLRVASSALEEEESAEPREFVGLLLNAASAAVVVAVVVAAASVMRPPRAAPSPTIRSARPTFGSSLLPALAIDFGSLILAAAPSLWRAVFRRRRTLRLVSRGGSTKEQKREEEEEQQQREVHTC